MEDAGLFNSHEEATQELTPLTANLFEGKRTFVVAGETLVGLAIFSVMYVARVKAWSRKLVAPFVITAVGRRVHVDGSRREQLYEVEADTGFGPAQRVTVTAADTVEAAGLRRVFAPVGGVHPTGASSATQGGVVVQIRALLDSRKWGPTRYTVETLGRVDAGTTDTGTQAVFALPGVTLAASGPVDGPCFLPMRPNTAAGRLVVCFEPAADHARLLETWLDAALAADPSPGSLILATHLGWAAALMFLEPARTAGLVAGFPMLWNGGVPGSGKTELVPRLLAPFGVHPTQVGSTLGTPAQIRDMYSATRDVPQVRDEVKMAYFSDELQRKFAELTKAAYNCGSAEVGGRYASAAFAQQTVSLRPTVVFCSEGSPPSDQAVLDRLIVVPWRRRTDLPELLQASTSQGFVRLRQATDELQMAPVAGAWYVYALNHDLRDALTQAAELLEGRRAGLSGRQLSNVTVVLAGLILFGQFCGGLSQQAGARVQQLVEQLVDGGVQLLADELQGRQRRTGALGALFDLAMLSGHTGPQAPRFGVHYRLEPDRLVINPGLALAFLRQQGSSVVSSPPDEPAFISEIRHWPGVEKLARRRPAGGTNAIAWWGVPWPTLLARGGPAHGDFLPADARP